MRNKFNQTARSSFFQTWPLAGTSPCYRQTHARGSRIPSPHVIPGHCVIETAHSSEFNITGLLSCPAQGSKHFRRWIWVGGTINLAEVALFTSSLLVLEIDLLVVVDWTFSVIDVDPVSVCMKHRVL